MRHRRSANSVRMAKLIEVAHAEPTEEHRDELVILINWFVERDYDGDLAALIASPDLSERAADRIRDCIDRCMYELEFVTAIGPVVATPISILLTFAIGPGEILPESLPETTTRLLSGLLRRMTDVGPRPSLVVCDRLLRPDDPLWLSPSRVRRMLEIACRKVIPFEYDPSPLVPPSSVNGEPERVAETVQYCVRGMLAIAFAPPTLNIGQFLFGDDGVGAAEFAQRDVEELESIVCDEVGCERVSVYPVALPLSNFPVEASWILFSDGLRQVLSNDATVYAGFYAGARRSPELRLCVLREGHVVWRHALDAAVVGSERAGQFVRETAAELGSSVHFGHEGVVAGTCSTCGGTMWPGVACHEPERKPGAGGARSPRRGKGK